MMEESKTRHKLEAELRHPVNDAIWEYLEDKYYVEEYEIGELTIERLAKQYQTLERLVRDAGMPIVAGPRGRSATRELARGAATSEDPDALLRSEILSAEAARLPEVVHWRAANLADIPGGLLAPHQLTAWISRIGEEDWKVHGQEGIALRYCYDTEYRYGMLPLLPEPLLGGVPDQPARMVRDPDDPSRQILMPFEGRHFLRWRAMGEKLFVEIPNDGRLFSLKCLAFLVCYRYLLAEEDAVDFILTGAPVLPFAGDYRVLEPVLAPARAYIRMTVDPGMSTSEVAALYGHAKGHLRTQRRRPLRDKARSLIAFCYPQVGFVSAQLRSSVRWDELRRAWNRSQISE